MLTPQENGERTRLECCIRRRAGCKASQTMFPAWKPETAGETLALRIARWRHGDRGRAAAAARALKASISALVRRIISSFGKSN